MKKEGIQANSLLAKIVSKICLLFIVIIICSTIIYISVFDRKIETSYDFSMDICSVNGITNYVTVDAQLIDNGIDPVHYKGTVCIDGVEYIDHISRFYSPHTTVLERISERRRGISYFDFYFPKSGSFGESIELTCLQDEEGRLCIKVRHIDFGESSIVDYYGPCYDGKSAECVKEIFEMYALSGGRN